MYCAREFRAAFYICRSGYNTLKAKVIVVNLRNTNRDFNVPASTFYSTHPFNLVTLKIFFCMN